MLERLTSSFKSFINNWSWKRFALSLCYLVPVLIILDQVTKWVVQLNVTPGDLVPIIDNFFYITLTYNTGSAGGMGAGVDAMRIIYILISWAMSVVFIYLWIKYVRKKKDIFLNIILVLCLSGAVGNLIDRTFYWPETTGFSGVIDFLCFYLQGGPSGPSISWMSPFPIFNLADSYLVIGVILFIIYLIVKMIKERKEEGREETPVTTKKDE